MNEINKLKELSVHAALKYPLVRLRVETLVLLETQRQFSDVQMWRQVIDWGFSKDPSHT